MAFLSVQKIQGVIAQLDQAVYNHEQWYKGLLRTLIARLPTDAQDLLPDAHRRCRFGQWYYSDETKALGDYPAFIALEQAHEQMHKSATRLLQRIADDLPVTASDIDQFSNVLDRMRLELQSLRSELLDMIQNLDPLTSARNRATMLSDLREQLALVRRGAQQCSLAMIDIDHFKNVNDQYGHPVGDFVLISTCRCLQELVRPYDYVYRYGGEEFLLCMPNTSIDTALVLTERLRSAVASQRIPVGDGRQALQITASFGVAVLESTRSVEESIDQADKALYEAKNKGRDRVETA